MVRFSLILFVVCFTALGGFGCASFKARSQGLQANGLGGNAEVRPVRPGELDELTRAFADRYVGLLSSTCDALKKDNPDVVQRREAQELMLNCATNVYDIASNADAFTRMLDLVVVTNLVAGVWVEDGRAREIFGDRADVLIRALEHGQAESRALAVRVLRPEQLEVLDTLMLDWRHENPDMVRMASVRFSNFAIGRGQSSTAKVLEARGWFANVGTAGRSVDEARLLTERMFYMLKRQPTLLRWEVEAIKDEFLATPEVAAYLADVHRLTAAAERLPANVAAEREAIVAAVDQRLTAVNATVAGVRSALAEAGLLAETVDDAGGSLDAMLRSAEKLLVRYDGLSKSPDAVPVRAFDVREYTEGIKELAVALQGMNEVLKSSDALLASPAWDRRMEDVNRSADARLGVAAEQTQIVVRAGFRQLWFTLGGVFLLLVLYRLSGIYLSRRSQRTRVGPHYPSPTLAEPMPFRRR